MKKVIFTITSLVILTNLVYAEQIPNYYKPYAPIYLDKDVYSWTDKIRITIIAPSWDENEHGIDSIGDDPNHAVKISTPSHSLGPYELRETAPSSGTFTGEVTLTGFLHDIDGDGESDTVPRTGGGGPTNGFLQVDRDDGITISFEFADGVVLTKSVQVSWNVGNIEFSKHNYVESEQILIQVTDPDMNINPEAIDNLNIDVSSDSDTAGISVVGSETDDESGVFVATILLTQTSESSGNRLRAVPGDTIVARYHDRTLPSPYSISDDLEITSMATIGSNVPGNNRMTVNDLYFADRSGSEISTLTSDNQIQIVTHVQNTQDYEQGFTNIIQITDSGGSVVSLSWMTARLGAGAVMEVSQSWLPKQKGEYTVESFVWRSLTDATPLSQTRTQSVIVE
ncbi:MAG TPA: hypothetical protein VNK44_02295 [Candidatus Nitrosotenuis sp.]|nr:hypothetical protein [Candidatus Nitrosotenuis sp.]